MFLLSGKGEAKSCGAILWSPIFFLRALAAPAQTPKEFSTGELAN
jgi:hypothetical protein